MKYMEKYEAPTLKFEEITFFENIANACWSHHRLHIEIPCHEDIIITLSENSQPLGHKKHKNKGCSNKITSIYWEESKDSLGGDYLGQVLGCQGSYIQNNVRGADHWS